MRKFLFRCLLAFLSIIGGGVVDLFAPDMRQPARIEYWDDEIDTIRSFDLLTQRRDENLKKIFISPAREVLFGDAAQTASALREFLSQRKGAKKEKLAEVMQVDLAALDGRACPLQYSVQKVQKP